MKFSPDCARDIMLAIEELAPNETLTLPKLTELYPQANTSTGFKNPCLDL